MCATIANRVLLLAGVLAVLCLLGGCASSARKPDRAREARVVAELNGFCRSLSSRVHPYATLNEKAVQARLAGLEQDLRRADGYLPAGRSLNEATAKRRALIRREAERSKSLEGSGDFLSTSPGPALVAQGYRLQVQIFDDKKALGLTPCLEPPVSYYLAR